VAAAEGNLETVKQLIALNADMSLKDVRGRDALAEAKREKR
jgi:hypothetical protein